MDESYDFKLNEVCRVCLSKIDNMINIIETNPHNSNIISMLISIGHFEIVINNFLPKYLCKGCENQLESSYKFQKTLQKSNEYLMKCFDENSHDTSKSLDYRLLKTEIEIPKDEPPESKNPANNAYDERFEVYEIVDYENRMIIDNNEDKTTDPLQTATVSSESDEEDSSSTCQITKKTAEDELIESFLPSKSKEQYKRCFARFLKWCEENQIENYTENCLLSYFQSDGLKSVWCNYSMLRSCLLLYKNVDISKYNNLLAYIKKENSTRDPKKSKVFTDEEVKKFINEAPDSTYLMMKVALIIGISGACRRDDLCRMTINDIKLKSDRICVEIPELKNFSGRRFVITDKQQVDLIKKYNSVRKSNKRFFLTYRNGQCINSPVGINTFGKIPYEIAQYLWLQCPEEYTGHCFRRTGKLKNRQKLLLKISS